jgi:nucleotide-binding universal stress UspA family protein
MGTILCATRGGEASYATQDAAIALAREQGDRLLFIFVIDVEFLSRTAMSVQPDAVRRDMDNMGEFLMEMARERAQKQGVEADYVLRHGRLREELKAAAVELDVDLVVLGRPEGDESAFAVENMEAFAAEIEKESGVPTRVMG